MFIKKFFSIMFFTLVIVSNCYNYSVEARDQYDDKRIYSGTVEGFVSNVSSIAKRNGINLKIQKDDGALGWRGHSYYLTLGTGNYITVNPMVYDDTDSLMRLWLTFNLTDNYRYDDGYISKISQNFMLMQILLSELGVDGNEIQNKFLKPFLNDVDKSIKIFKKNYSYDNDDDHIFVDKNYKIYCKKIKSYLKIKSYISIYKYDHNSVEFTIERLDE